MTASSRKSFGKLPRAISQHFSRKVCNEPEEPNLMDLIRQKVSEAVSFLWDHPVGSFLLLAPDIDDRNFMLRKSAA